MSTKINTTETPCCGNPYLYWGNCEKFMESWKKLANVIPDGPSGNGTPKLSCPYGTTPMPLPTIPYEPKTMSVNRIPWDGWRYGSNYVHTDGIERNYGFPDYQYYRHNYCGPCCPCVPGMNPPLAGDPDGKNPNIRYIQLDYKNLLGSGFATQGPPTSQMSPFMMGGNPGAATSCGKNHCTECSGVYKKSQQPVKFQVCIGDQKKPETVQPCPMQPMKVYLPLSVLPRGGPDGDQPDCEGNEGTCESQDNCNKAPIQTNTGKQQYEVFVPDQAQECGYYNEQNLGPAQVEAKCDKEEAKPSKGVFDPCGCCKACKVPAEFAKLKTEPLGRKKRQILTFPVPNNKNNKPLFIRPTEPPMVFNNETC